MASGWWARYKAIPARSRAFLGMFGIAMALGGMTAMQYYDLSEEGQERLRKKREAKRLGQ